MKTAGKKLVALGDSITEGVGVANPENIYVSALRSALGLRESKNFGISGTRFARQKNPTVDAPLFDRDFCSRVEELDDDADIVLVFGGTNDFNHGDAPMGEFSDRTVWTFYGACHVLFSSLDEKYAGKTVVIMTPLHSSIERLGGGEGCQPENGRPDLGDFVRAIREVAEFYSLPVLDLYAASGIQPKLPAIKAALCPDGLHPNDAGHAVLTSRIAAFLTSL